MAASALDIFMAELKDGVTIAAPVGGEAVMRIASTQSANLGPATHDANLHLRELEFEPKFSR